MHVRLITFVLLVVFFGLMTGVHAEEKLTANQIVAACDKVRNPEKPFSFVEDLVVYKSNKPIKKMRLVVYAKEDEDSGQFRSLIRFLAPPRDKNKIMMKNGNVLWFHDPSTKASVRISPKQRLLGQASNGDIMSVNLAKDYEAEIGGQETIKDTKRKNRDCYKIDLSAINNSVTYDKIEFWIEKKTFIPIKGKFYSESGRLLKTAYYRNMKYHLGRKRPSETIIIDGLDRKQITKITHKNYQFQTIPDSWFQKEYLPRFKGLN
ncbi:MAG: outer membrane lipoprotein-sorting protein [Proteobacteria bacterium]|nr:outer membrane lipoprotein-sorting protein [Pseudomonadota bacterium]